MEKQQKNILLLSPFFFPEPISTGKFNTDLAIALRDQGHKITILCFHPFYPKWEVIKSTEKIAEITIIRGGKNLKYPQKTILRRMVLEIGYSFFVLRKILKIQKKIDIIIPVFPPSLAFYLLIPFLKQRIKKVGLVHDLQSVYSSKKKGFVNAIIRKIIYKVEKKAFQYCNRLIFLSNEMKEIAKNQYHLKASKLKVQYPFVTTNPKNKTNDLGSILKDTKQHIVYSGALGEKQNPKGLYQLFDHVSKEIPEVLFHFFSQGTIFDILKNDNVNPRIQFHDLVAKKNIEELYRRSTIQIVPQLSGTSKGSLPSKLPNLLALGTPIICITDKGSEIDILFKKHSLDTVVTSWEKENLYQTFNKLLQKKSNNSKEQIEISNKLFSINSMISTILET